MSMEELKKDAAEFGKLLSEAGRERVKHDIQEDKQKVEKEMDLEMKVENTEERKAAGDAPHHRKDIETSHTKGRCCWCPVDGSYGESSPVCSVCGAHGSQAVKDLK